MNTVFRKPITVDEISKKIHLILRYVNHNLKKKKNKVHACLHHLAHKPKPPYCHSMPDWIKSHHV